MKTFLKTVALFTLSTFLLACSSDKKVMLFNGKDLDNWIFFTENEEVEPGDVFWVEDGVIHTSGQPNSYIRTRESYSNFKLHVEWRWTGEPTNSGVLIHVRGKDMIWPLAIECQLMHENAGDVVCIGEGSGITIRDTTYLITPGDRRYHIIGKSEKTSENQPGEWNSYDITSQDGNLEALVNGVLQNQGTGMTLREGYILLQAEGSPIQFRNIYLEPL
jgi:hypothetical protein